MNIVVWTYHHNGRCEWKLDEWVSFNGTPEQLTAEVKRLADDRFATAPATMSHLRVEGRVLTGDEYDNTLFIASAWRATEAFKRELGEVDKGE